MYYILYSSYATADFTDLELKELLIQSQTKNKTLGVTGMLFFLPANSFNLLKERSR